MYSEAEVGTHDIVTDESELLSLLDSDLKTVNSDRVLGTNIEISVLRADAVTCDHHTLDNRKGITFEDGTIHECAGVTLVTVTDNVLVAAAVDRERRPASSTSCATS